MRAATGVLIALALLAGVALIAGLWLDTRENVETRCWLDDAPVGVSVSESALISAEETVWPVGRRCEWEPAAGDGVIVTQTGWARTTVFVVVGLASAVWAVVGAARRRRAAAVPFAVCVGLVAVVVFWTG
ncbi:hypothetical protein NH287_00885 [Microbacterium sp. CnD16-F]|uniref:hypothetical protein n=1 Tax=Microbacterium sp. CnD16-F TaxID=2954493 RepID=UPI0020971E98|nr:hypothetical protein [Microbacterium sp. CnD16-F]MCO7202072.1 hypothetical protein [Microbacterium sp. CnD16-F]